MPRYGTHSNFKRGKYQEFYPRRSKRVIDEIDIALARALGLSSEAVDFLINYDIKYRIGGGLDEDDADD